MKLVLLTAIVTPWLLAQSGSAVEGVVTNAATKAGIPGVSVALSANNGKGMAYQAVTDQSGSFRIADVSPGRYIPHFEKTGFDRPSQEDPAGRPILVSATGARLNVALDPLSSISGRVLDSDRQPLANVDVDLIGPYTVFRPTDKEGRFHFDDLPPDSYLLVAHPFHSALRSAEGRIQRTPEKHLPAPSEGMAWATTWYPGVTDATSAAKIAIAGGVELTGYDIRMRPVPVFHVRGRLRDERGTPAAGVGVALFSAVRLPTPLARVVSAADGGFDFPDVPAGNWTLISEIREPARKGVAQANVIDRDLDGLRITLATAFAWTGETQRDAIIEGSDPAPRLTLQPVDWPENDPPRGTADKQGRLKFSTVFPGRYRIVCRGAVVGNYLAAMTIGGRDVTGQIVELSANMPPLRLIYRKDGGRLTGKVVDGANLPVLIWPQDDSLRDSLSLSILTDSEGRFQAADLRPGDYYALAADHPSYGRFDENTYRAAAAAAVRWHVEAGATASIELRVVPWPE